MTVPHVTRRSVRIRVKALFAGFSFIAAVLLVVLAECVLSAFAPDGWRQLSERRHAEFDPLLGWVNQAGVTIADCYGPGVGLSTNARRFRGRRETEDAIPAGKTRIVCSGDSFTLGYGVADAETYPQQIEALDSRLEAVNMGQGGYGVDQAYLWYRRDATFAHDIQIFAFITADLRRMRSPQFFGYSKPLLVLEGGQLHPVNIPLENMEEEPQSRIGTMLRRSVGRSRLATLGRVLSGRTRTSDDGVLADDEWQCFEAILTELVELNRQRHSVLCVAWLPASVRDYTGDESDLPRKRVARFCAQRQIHFVDVVESWKRLPSVADAAGMISDASLHYSPAGNRFVAEVLYRGLQEQGLLPYPATPVTQTGTAETVR